MTTFALVAEGPTDQFVIESVLLGLFSDQDEEPEINRVQPPVDGTSGAAGYGGWALVVDHFARGDHHQTMAFNDYLIVHLDTDIVHHPPLSLDHISGEAPEQLIERVRQRLCQEMGPSFMAAYGDRVFFAIAVDAIECWLLPLWASGNKRAKTTGCLKTCNRALQRQNKRVLSKDDPRSYEAASSPLRKQKTLLSRYTANPSLRVFVDAVLAAKIVVS